METTGSAVSTQFVPVSPVEHIEAKDEVLSPVPGEVFVGYRYRGLRYAHAPAIIVQPVPGFQNGSLTGFQP